MRRKKDPERHEYDKRQAHKRTLQKVLNDIEQQDRAFLAARYGDPDAEASSECDEEDEEEEVQNQNKSNSGKKVLDRTAPMHIRKRGRVPIVKAAPVFNNHQEEDDNQQDEDDSQDEEESLMGTPPSAQPPPVVKKKRPAPSAQSSVVKKKRTLQDQPNTDRATLQDQPNTARATSETPRNKWGFDDNGIDREGNDILGFNRNGINAANQKLDDIPDDMLELIWCRVTTMLHEGIYIRPSCPLDIPRYLEELGFNLEAVRKEFPFENIPESYTTHDSTNSAAATWGRTKKDKTALEQSKSQGIKEGNFRQERHAF